MKLHFLNPSINTINTINTSYFEIVLICFFFAVSKCFCSFFWSTNTTAFIGELSNNQSRLYNIWVIAVTILLKIGHWLVYYNLIICRPEQHLYINFVRSVINSNADCLKSILWRIVLCSNCDILFLLCHIPNSTQTHP